MASLFRMITSSYTPRITSSRSTYCRLLYRYRDKVQYSMTCMTGSSPFCLAACSTYVRKLFLGLSGTHGKKLSSPSFLNAKYFIFRLSLYSLPNSPTVVPTTSTVCIGTSFARASLHARFNSAIWRFAKFGGGARLVEIAIIASRNFQN